MTANSAPQGLFRRGLQTLKYQISFHPVPFIVAVIGATIFSLALVAGTWVLGWATDNVIMPAFDEGGVKRGVIFSGVGAIIGLTLVRAVGVVLRRYFGAMASHKVQATMRNNITDTYLDVPLEYHLNTPTGELLAHADADVEAAAEAIIPLPLTTGVVSIVLFSTVALALIDPVMMLVGLAIFPTLAVMNRLYTARVEAPSALVQQRIGEVSNVAHESFDGALIVKALGREKAEIARMAEASDRLREARIQVGRLRALFESTLKAIPSLGMVILLLVGSWRLSEGAITTGDIVTSIALFGVLVAPMWVAGYFLEELPRSVVAFERVRGVLELQPEPLPRHNQGRLHATIGDLDTNIQTNSNHSGASSAQEETSAAWAGAEALANGVANGNSRKARAAVVPLSISVSNVSYAYGTSAGDVLKGISFSAQAGEVVALVGTTGAGKSTLCQLLVGLIDPAVGEVRINNVPINEVDVDELRAETAIVFQESFLFAETVRENILVSAEVSQVALDQAAQVAQASEFIANLPAGYETEMGERGVSLSGGQRQRVALARALVRQPGLLVLDDATSAVDPVIEARILQGLRQSLGSTTIIVANRISTIELADKVVYLDAGRVVAAGTHEELLGNPRYERLVRAYEEEVIE